MINLNIKVNLQGPYNASLGLMDANLKMLVGFPLTEPYTNLAPKFVHVGDGGGEMIERMLILNSSETAIVDWVFVEVRDRTDNTNVLSTRAGLLLRNGNIVDCDGFSALSFTDLNPDHYFIAVRHRNHLGCMTKNPTSATSIDFTLGSTETFGSTPTSARKLLSTGVYGLWAGNVNLNDNIRYTGIDDDKTAILAKVGDPLNVVQGYFLEDVNLNGFVKYNGSGNDRVIILNNVGVGTPNNVIVEELP